MKIRDAYAQLNGDDTYYDMPSGGLNIIGEDGCTMFSISIKDNVLQIDGGMVCKQNGRLLDNRFIIKPRAANCVDLIKPEYDS